MRDDQNADAPPHQAPHQRPHARSSLSVQPARRLIQDQDRAVAHERPRDAHPLHLAAGQAHAAVADARRVALGQRGDESVDAGEGGGALDGAGRAQRRRGGEAVADVVR